MAHAEGAYASEFSESSLRLSRFIREPSSGMARVVARPVVAAAVLLLIASASAEELTPQISAPVVASRARLQDNTTNTWVIFGFTEGADAGERGERGLYYDSVVRFSRRDAPSSGLRSTAGFVYSPSDRAAWWLGTSITHLQGGAALLGPGSPCCGLSEDSSNIGALGGLKYRIVPRDSSAIGVSVQIEPYWERPIKRSAETQQAFGSDFRLIIDKVLYHERLFAALNVAYQPDGTMSRGQIAWTSSLELAAAISAKMTDYLIVGFEARYLQSYSGSFFDEECGRAVFAGPTLSLPLGDSAYFGAAWSKQLFGKATGDPIGKLDLINYERHQVRLKFGASF